MIMQKVFTEINKIISRYLEWIMCLLMKNLKKYIMKLVNCINYNNFSAILLMFLQEMIIIRTIFTPHLTQFH
jgi:hypothetical protein